LVLSWHPNIRERILKYFAPSPIPIRERKLLGGCREVIEISNINSCLLSSKCISMKGEKKG
jgi:hypothetical protein